MISLGIIEAKQEFIDFLYSRPVYIRAVSRDLYLTRCPFCGDSRTTARTGHLYILVKPDTNYKMVYYCQKCQEHGTVGQELVTMLDGNESVLNCVMGINKTAISASHTQQEVGFRSFDVSLPDIVAPAYVKKVRYVENRLGISIDKTLMRELKIIVSPYDFLVMNDIKETRYKKNMMNCLERDYVGFLSTGGSHILFRDITDTHEYSWLKYPIFYDSKYNHVFYSYSSGDIDVFDKDPITVNLSEGVMDAIGVKHHFYKDVSNDLNIAVCGRNYYSIIKWLVSIGVFGSQVKLNFYLDNDAQYSNGKELALPNALIQRVKALFGQVTTYKNLIGKDYGVAKDKIMLDKRVV